ncbi:MAG: hypothetical protein JWN11_1744, partial [Hyphomicrobiales bacterium]|nr:hypothetical protein [Hyphomicrobiales bacterium]
MLAFPDQPNLPRSQTAALRQDFEDVWRESDTAA